MSCLWNNLQETDLKGYTVIIPSVAVGNVGQLTCDLLISSLALKKVASVYSPALIPVLGYDPYDLTSNSIASCCELYKSESINIAVLQVRAPLVFKYAQSFLTEVVQKLKQKDIKDIVVLTSSFAHEKKHIMTSPFRYIANNTSSLKEQVKTVGLCEHNSTETGLKIFGGGFAALLFEKCVSNSLGCLILYKFSSEGDNIPDAYEMIQCLSSVLPLFKESKSFSSQLVEPVSWKLLFGGPPPRDIY